MRDSTFGRVLPAEHRVITSLYLAVVRTLYSVGFYEGRNERYASIVRSLVGSSLQEGRLVVDLGCGPGGITALLGGSHVLLGVDSDRYYLTRFVEPRIQRIQARAEHLPLRSNCVDVFLAISLVEHIANQSAFFEELSRVLKPGGILVLQVPELRFPIEPHTKWPLLHIWNPSIQARILSATGYEDLNMSTTIPKVKQLAEAAGLRVQKLIPLKHFRLAIIVRLAMGYFIAFTSVRHA